MFGKIISASLGIYIMGSVIAWTAEQTCKGWSCEVVSCPNGYAVEIPGEGYLPCELFDEFVETKNKELLK